MRYHVQGKGTYHNILIITASMRTLMEVGQLDKLTAYYGNYVHNYNADVLLKGILRQATLQINIIGYANAWPSESCSRTIQAAAVV